ncbi:MAG: MMPL family transporter [Thalassolituus sp.]
MFRLTVLFATRYPKPVVWASVIITLLFCLALPMVHVDTDPENMLPEDNPGRVYHNEIKQEMALYDLLVVAMTLDDQASDKGVFTPESLQHMQTLMNYAATLEGVISHEILAPYNVDAIEPAGLGTIRFQRIMPTVPYDQAGADRVRQRIVDNPFLWETVISTDKQSLAVYIPIEKKEYSWRISNQLKDKIAEIDGTETYHITGLPVAEDTFGVEMFIQMAISAPLAMLLVGALIWYFVRSMALTVAALLVAMLSVMTTMGAFVATGNTLHIMSSMIPIFIMPIAVLDAVHILSQFYDRYRGDREEALVAVMKDLWKPMLFTTLTTSVGFISLLLAPIPPVQVFGLFTGIGVLLAWLLSMTFLPAYICLMSEKKLQSFGSANVNQVSPEDDRLARFLQSVREQGWRFGKLVLLVGVLLVGGAYWGVTQLQVNDNPVKWFEADHPIREADTFISEHFGGSYNVYLTFYQPFTQGDVDGVKDRLRSEFSAFEEQGNSLIALMESNDELTSPVELIHVLRAEVNRHLTGDTDSPDAGEPEFELEEEPDFEMMDDDSVSEEAEYSNWRALDNVLEAQLNQYQIMKLPAMLNWLAGLEIVLEKEVQGGKVYGIPTLIRKVNKELHDGEVSYSRIPDTRSQVMETYVSFQNSHDLNRLWHMVTPDYTSTTLMLQLKSGDNQDVAAVVQALEQWMAENPAPVSVKYGWSGLAYINVIWQEEMVTGMVDALLGSGVFVFVMMIFLFRNLWWAAVSMIPLSLSILVIYGALGVLGKDYDMPVAVLSALALGLSVDFAIHFITHLREYAANNSPAEAMRKVFGEPARAIYRNAVVITLGFTPLLVAPLVPYQTVGYLMMAIMLVSSVASFYLFPALISQVWISALLFGRKPAPDADETPAKTKHAA